MKNLDRAAKCCGAENQLGCVFRAGVASNSFSSREELAAFSDAEIDIGLRIVPIRIEYGPGETAPSNGFKRLLAACILAEINPAAIFLCAGMYLCPNLFMRTQRFRM